MPRARRVTPELFDLDSIHAAYEWCYGCVSEPSRAYLQVGKLCHLVDLGLIDVAGEEAERLAAGGVAIFESSRDYAIGCLGVATRRLNAGLEEGDVERLDAMRRVLSAAPSAGP